VRLHGSIEGFERHRSRYGKDLRPRRHYLAHHLVAKLDHAAHELAVFLIEHTLFLAGFEQCIHRLVSVFGLGNLGLGQPRDREQQLDGQREWKHEVKQNPHRHGNACCPLAARSRKEDLRQQTVKDKQHEHQLEYGASDLRRAAPHAPMQPHRQQKDERSERNLPQHRG
jgi:hypothetical protein